jgi:hypothetical protein
VAAILLAMLVYYLGTRYQMVATAENENNYVYMYDRFTGKMWRVTGTFPDYYVPMLGFSDDKEAKKELLGIIKKKPNN